MTARSERNQIGSHSNTAQDPEVERGRLLPLVVATGASQALLVVLAPTMVAMARDLGTSVGAVAQARTVTATLAIVVSILAASRIDRVGVSRLLGVGAVGAVLGCVAVALAPTFPLFLAAHTVIGFGFACLLSAGFAGVAAFPSAYRGRAMGYLAAANAGAWIVVNPVVGFVTEHFSWSGHWPSRRPWLLSHSLLSRLRPPSSAPSGPSAYGQCYRFPQPGDG